MLKMTSRTRKQVTLHFKRCGLKKYCKMKCLMTPMSGIELCHALTIEFYNANSHLVVCRLKYLGFQYYHPQRLKCNVTCFRVRDVIFRVSFSRTFSKKKKKFIFVTESLFFIASNDSFKSEFSSQCLLIFQD
jgi:hypothetical protein